MFRDPFPIFQADDVAALVSFYTKACGFELMYLWPSDGRLEFAFLKLGAQGIGIAASGSHQHVQGLSPGTSPPFELCIYTDRMDDALARLTAAGARPLMEPTDQPWGERVCYLSDPQGHAIHLTQKLS